MKTCKYMQTQTQQPLQQPLQQPRQQHRSHGRERRWAALVLAMALMSACAQPPAVRPAAVAAAPAPVSPPTGPTSSSGPTDSYRWLDRLTWGATPSLVETQGRMGYGAYVAQQLHPAPGARLPAAAQAQVDAMTITQQPMTALVFALEAQRKESDALPAEDDRKTAQQANQKEMSRIAREAATRHVLRALYSPSQVQEQMTWFWLNHFNVFQGKANIRVLVGDYEDAIRPRALGRFRDLLAAVVYHPAMLRYLDNEQNAANRINENFARELMELHTLGVNGGYSQRDVQELARVLTGVGVNLQPADATVRRELAPYYVRRGLFEFNPNRHDFGPKEFLGQPLRGKGLAEVDEAMDRLARQPATARFISQRLAEFWLSDDPPKALVQRMADAFLRSDGDIADTLHTLFMSPEFTQGKPRKFKDPMHYVLSAVRLAYDDKPILNAGPILNWLNRMGEPLYGHQTPDGYPLGEASWASPGQMATRFEVAKAIGSGNAGLFRAEGPQPLERPAFPQLANALYYQAIRRSLGPGTQQALEQAGSPQEWNTFLLSSPEMMLR